MTEKEYIEITKKYPRPYSTYEKHVHYEGEEEDYKMLIEYNKKLIEDFPFLQPKNWKTGLVGEDYNYESTWLDDMPDGWRLAFGREMCQEIKDALLAVQEKDPEGGYPEKWYTTNYDSDKILSYLDGYQITQIKEKYGSLRWYDNGAPQEVLDIVHKYEKLSSNICINCGQPAKWETVGWICPYCDDCKNKLESEINDEFVRLEKE